ncbi:hypothetical protein [Methylomonas methanica]|uniref:Pili assembly chaperone n=1 Tax=Methylomonas methanica (strain DSM 25384 / MC09) TaxID=857087 RepID=G0A579_METMM|nr:hypothetical protein [Methylomonas methanica]AEG00409.1 hypothetical protein Metme_1998 [Methylomonas methanica MC09]
MNPNPQHPAGLLILSILWITIAGCAPIKPEQTQFVSAQDNQASRLGTNQVLRAATNNKLSANVSRSQPKQSTPTIQTGRYSTLAATPTPAQRDPLAVIIDVTIPETCVSIEQAIRFLLRRSGYELDTALSVDIIELMAKPLPAVHRQLGPMPLSDALTLLVTPSFVLQDDPIKRLLRFVPIDGNRGGRL